MPDPDDEAESVDLGLAKFLKPKGVE